MNLVFLQRGQLYGAIVILLMGISCGNPREGQSVQNGSADAQSEIMNSHPAKRLLNYWDGFNVHPKLLVVYHDELEKELVVLLALFPPMPDTVVQTPVPSMLKEASVEPGTFSYLLDKYNHYLYGPNAPMRNDEYYEQVLS